MGKKSRTKGSAGELEVCKLLSEIYPNAARELEQYQGTLGRDLRCTEPLCVQVKRHKTLSPGAVSRALEEARSAVDEDYKYPAVFYREDNRQWRVRIKMSDLLVYIGIFALVSEKANIELDIDAKDFVALSDEAR